MENPKKIILKFKNKNRRTQYNCYIFLGPLISEKIRDILKKIEDKSFFDTIILLKKHEIKTLSEKYSEFWYKFFFNFYHLEFEFKKILSTSNKIKQIKKKQGQKWLNDHIKINKLILPKLRHSYKYETSKILIYNIMINKKRQKKLLISEDVDINDYRVKNIIQTGGDNEESDNISFMDQLEISSDNKTNTEEINTEEINTEEINTEETNTEEINTENNNILETTIKSSEIETEHNINEISLDDIENDFFKKIDADSKLEQTSKLINRAIEQGKIKVSSDKKNKFPDEKNNNMFDENIKNNYNKIYIYSTYIFNDDSISKIKKKISISIINNPVFIGKFKHENYISPSRIYLYAKHKYKDRFNSNLAEESIMIGQKWIRKNELLKIDIEPSNNLKDYEELKGNLKYLASNILKSSSKIRRENNQAYLLDHYSNYIQNNDIYMLDLYNELGENYGIDKNNSQIKNIFDTYVRIYFPEIIYDDFKKILDYLNIDNTDQLRRDEITYIREIYETNKNDLFLESQITSTIEELKLKNNLYNKIVKYNYITQAVTHILLDEKNMSATNRKRLDLFRIFDNFITSDNYPFVQWQMSDGSIMIKHYKKSTEKDKDAILAKWVQHTPYGISFKVKTNIKDLSKNSSEFKYIAINLNENGRLEYKTQYKEDNKATMSDIYDTYEIVKQLLKKINSETRSIKFLYPKNEDFKFAFINSIIKFELPKKAIIDHNKLSELCRYFYPYIVLVIEPRKREAKIKKEDGKSKYGTYLRYKRIDNYDTDQRIELKIIYFLKNYEFNINALAVELSKQYNITEKEAVNKINEVKSKFNIRKIRRVLKKLNEIPKLKTPGIEIEIQGKNVNNYKIRISGARNKTQLNKIVHFLEILLFLYYDTYINKSTKRVKLLNTLKLLHNIAKRRNKVLEPKLRRDETKKVKRIAKNDPKRLGFKPKQGQDHWSRACQNSGKKNRQPDQILGTNIHKLTNKGFKLNKDNGMYEKEIKVKVGKSKKTRIIRAIKQNSGAGEIYYTCSPEINGKYMHIGFLTRSINPSGLCMPCCYKIDQFTKYNNPQRDFFLKCIGKNEDIAFKSSNLYGEKLYILQDTNKIQEGRYGLLPKFLDILLNKNFNKNKKIENHYLIEAETGYLFKYGVDIRSLQFLNCMRSIFNLTKDEFLHKIKVAINKNPNIFIFLNSGDIKKQFGTKEDFFTFLETTIFLNDKLISDIFYIPGIFSEFGYNLIIYEKKIYKDNNDKIKTKFVINCPKRDIINYMKNDTYKNILILKENNFYYPIFEIIKSKTSTKFNIYKTFDYNSNFITIFRDFILKNCKNNIITNNFYYARNIILYFEKNNIQIKGQIIDNRNKCIFILTNKILIPCIASGIDYKYKVYNDYSNHILNFKTTIEEYKKIFKIIVKQNQKFFKFQGYSVINNNKNNYEIGGILLDKNLIIPIKKKRVAFTDLKKIANKFDCEKFILENIAFDREVDKTIEENIKVIDSRIKQISLKNYEMESYQLFKLELSNKISNNTIFLKLIEEIINSKDTKKIKRNKLKDIIYKNLDKKLYKTLKQKGGDISLTKNIKVPDKYTISNTRELCNIHKNRNICNSHINCLWKGKVCNFKLTYEKAVKFVNQLIEELIDSEYKANEILQKDEYYVSDIVDFNSFTPRINQSIIKSNSMNANIVLSEIFGENSIPTIGKKMYKKDNEITDRIKFKYEQIGNLIYQKIKNNNIIFRVLANCYYWLKNITFTIKDRNLGFYSKTQTNLANYIRGSIINWLANIKNWKFIKNNLKGINIDKGIYGLDNYINDISNPSYTSNFINELIIFNIIFKIDIYILNNSNNIINIIHNAKLEKSSININTAIISNKSIIIKYDSNSLDTNFIALYSVYKIKL
jgi:hypothetical protein